MWFHSSTVVLDSMNGSHCAWACARFILLVLNCLLVSFILLLKHSLSSRLYFIDSRIQLPLAEFNLPCLKFYPWLKVFDTVLLSYSVTIRLVVFISCTDSGVALCWSSS